MEAERLEALYQLLSRLEAKWLPKPPRDQGEEFFGYDPLPIACFFEDLDVVERAATGKRFMDVGCGMGTKLALMHYLGWEVAGIDRYEPFTDVCRQFVPEASVLCADAFSVTEFDADVVYAYRPCVADDREVALEQHIAACAPSGALLWLPERTVPTPVMLERLSRHVWRVG